MSSSVTEPVFLESPRTFSHIWCSRCYPNRKAGDRVVAHCGEQTTLWRDARQAMHNRTNDLPVCERCVTEREKSRSCPACGVGRTPLDYRK